MQQLCTLSERYFNYNRVVLKYYEDLKIRYNAF